MIPAFVALDGTDPAAMRSLALRLDGAVAGVKLGTAFCLGQGIDAVRRVVDGTGHRLFLDLKLHDIPETVRRTLLAALPAAPDLVTLHAAGARRMAEAALEAAASAPRPPTLLAVTVLTSMDAADLAEIGAETGAASADPAAAVRGWAMRVRGWGLGGLVCAPAEAAVVREAEAQDRTPSGQAPAGQAPAGQAPSGMDAARPALTLVTPGIRPGGAVPGDDQRRTATPAEALRLGADWLVIGRPITGAPDPREAVERIRSDIEQQRRGQA